MAYMKWRFTLFRTIPLSRFFRHTGRCNFSFIHLLVCLRTERPFIPLAIILPGLYRPPNLADLNCLAVGLVGIVVLHGKLDRYFVDAAHEVEFFLELGQFAGTLRTTVCSTFRVTLLFEYIFRKTVRNKTNRYYHNRYYVMRDFTVCGVGAWEEEGGGTRQGE